MALNRSVARQNCTAKAMGHLIEAVFVIGIGLGSFSVSVHTKFLSREERALYSLGSSRG